MERVEFAKKCTNLSFLVSVLSKIIHYNTFDLKQCEGSESFV